MNPRKNNRCSGDQPDTGVWRGFRRKVITCSVEAAIISIAVHVFLLLFAGSVVVFNFAGKRAIEFKGENLERADLERRALPVPVKVQALPRKGPPPLMVKQVLKPSISSVRLPVPPPSEIGFDLEAMALHRESIRQARLPGNLKMGISKVEFFGTRSAGEKVVFILDASKQMMEDAKGGYPTYQYAKEEIHRLVDSMSSATLFNVVVYSGKNVDLFRPTLVPAAPASRAALLEWLEPINRDPYDVGRVPGTYASDASYDSRLGGNAQYWLKAVQFSMEQTADAIFVLCAGVGRYSDPLAERPTRTPPDPDELAAYLAEVAELRAKAQDALRKENDARQKRGLAPKIIYDWNRYMRDELRLVMPTPPSTSRSGASVEWTPKELILDHLDAIYTDRYEPKNLDAPVVNFVYLIASDAGTHREYDDISILKKVAAEYGGTFRLLLGSDTVYNLTF